LALSQTKSAAPPKNPAIVLNSSASRLQAQLKLAGTLKNATEPLLRATKSKQLGLEIQRVESLKPASLKTPSVSFKTSGWFISKTVNPPTTNNQSEARYKHSAKALNPKTRRKIENFKTLGYFPQDALSFIVSKC
jgi:hypothetical protein